MIIDMTQTKIEERIELRLDWNRGLAALGKAASPETVGAFPNRQDITVFPADDIRKLRLGWIIRETIGIAVINTRGLDDLAAGEN